VVFVLAGAAGKKRVKKGKSLSLHTRRAGHFRHAITHIIISPFTLPISIKISV